MSQIIVVRHCESSGQAPEAGLTERGTEQAAALADFLSRYQVDHIVSSPYRRAQQTIAPFAARVRLDVRLDHRLAERRLADGPIDNWRDVIRTSFDDLDFKVAGGESGREALLRGLAAIEGLLAHHHELPIIVSHGQLLSLIFNSIDSSFGFAGWESLANPDVYVLETAASGSFAFTRAWA